MYRVCVRVDENMAFKWLALHARHERRVDPHDVRHGSCAVVEQVFRHDGDERVLPSERMQEMDDTEYNAADDTQRRRRYNYSSI